MDKTKTAIAMLAAGALMSACVPYPIYKTLQPAARVTVVDQNNAPLANAEVTLIAGAYPYGREKARVAKFTDERGSARFDAVREMRVETMMLHGAEDYFWNWCVRKEGYATYRTRDRSSADFQPVLRVQMTPGRNEACPAGR